MADAMGASLSAVTIVKKVGVGGIDKDDEMDSA